jgi:hypothetical protein
MKKNKLVIFGPWLGEFCFELSWYIPEIRKLKQTKYEGWHSVMVGFNGRKILYLDFVDDYIPYPQELEDCSIYPSGGGEYRGGKMEIIPLEFSDFLKQIKEQYMDDFDEVVIESPVPEHFSLNTSNLTREQNPDGYYRHYQARKEILDSVRNKITFENQGIGFHKRDTIAVMARIRYRNGNVCKLDWDPKHWETFVDMLINNLKVNIVMIGIPRKEGSSAGGALSMEDTDMYKKNKKYIKSIIFNGEDSVEEQIALLQSTKCSIYGATGAVVFPFFIKGANIFTQQTSENANRLEFEWQRRLTDNLKNIKIFGKYSKGAIYNSSVDELFKEFKIFYEELKNE